MDRTAGRATEETPRLTLLLLATAIPSDHSPGSDESAAVLAAARVGLAAEPQKLLDTTDLPALRRMELRGAIALPKPMPYMNKWSGSAPKHPKTCLGADKADILMNKFIKIHRRHRLSSPSSKGISM